MERDAFLAYLDADFRRLRDVAADPAATVPTCPEWTVDDLRRHVATVYLHKVETMRRGGNPDPWPPDLTGEATTALLDRSHAALIDEFATRADSDRASTWYDSDQSVGFWVRRMAHETVIHRVDAELAAGEPIAVIPADLAADGIDEVLETFLAYASRKWPEDFGDLLRDDGAVLVATGGARWLVRVGQGAVRVVPDTAGQAAAQVSGDPAAVLLWLWRRAGDEAVRIDGDAAAVRRLREMMEAATQ
jgi:uncharacterized protein (TIGR03083 family)